MPERLTGFLLRLLRLLLSFPHCEIHEQISELMVSTTLIGQKWKVIAESSSATWSPCLTRRNVGVSHFEVIRNSTYSAKPSASINLVVSATSSRLHKVSDQSRGVAQIMRQRKCLAIAE
uniref:Secreted protein n=1 Tax=Mesocestoides corti TaxID=53468 RepID=A0A5K3FSH8_MESCO